MFIKIIKDLEEEIQNKDAKIALLENKIKALENLLEKADQEIQELTQELEMSDSYFDNIVLIDPNAEEYTITARLTTDDDEGE